MDTCSQIWLGRLSLNPLAAANALKAQLLATPISSIAVEKKHLHGQESRKVRSRGLAITADELPRRTYQKTIALDNRVRTQRVMKAVLPNADRYAFGRFIRAASTQKRNVRDTHREAKSLLACRRQSLNRTTAGKCSLEPTTQLITCFFAIV